MAPGFRLVTFGGLSLLREGSPVSGVVGQRKRLALLAMLAEARGGLSREAVTAMLWPESDSERARNSVAQSVHALRRELGDSAIVATNGWLALDVGIVSCDVTDFRLALEGGGYRAAVDLYRGPFLDGLFLRDAPGFERWCDEQRLDLARLNLGALQHLAERATRDGDWSTAVQWWGRCAATDPLSGRIARSYMEALAADGRREDAIRHAEIHAELVRADLGAEPAADVLALAADLRRTPGPIHARSTIVPEPDEPPVLPGMIVTTPPPIVPVELGPDAIRFATRAESRRRTFFRGFPYAVAAALAGVAVMAVATMCRPALTDRRVVVAAFENRTGDPSLDPLGFMAADLIAQGLQGTRLMEVADPATAALASRTARSEGVPLGSAREIRAMARETHARLVVTGSYYRDADTLVMAAQIADARDEQLLDALIPMRVGISVPAAAVALVRERVLGALAMRLDQRLDPIIPPGSSPPPTYAAYLDFMRGLTAYQHQERKAAIDFFARAAAADSTFALPLVWSVWALGTGTPASDSIVRRLAVRREQLAPLDRVAVDYQQASARRDYRGKLAAATEAVRLAPGSHWGHNLGFTLTDLGRFDEAIAAFETIDRRKGWTRGWPTYWERFAVALHLAGKFDRELEIAREARRALPSLASPVFIEARALAAAGRVRELNVVLQELQAYDNLADSLNLGPLLSLVARELETSGDTASARRVHDRAVSWFASLPAEKRAAPAEQLQFASALYRAGRYAEAKPILTRLVADPAVPKRRNPNFDPYAQLGGVYAYLGDREQADSVIESLLRDQSAPQLAIALHWAARIATALGDKERAVDYLRRQIALTGRGAGFHYDNRDLDPLLNYPPYRSLVDASTRPAQGRLALRGW